MSAFIYSQRSARTIGPSSEAVMSAAVGAGDDAVPRGVTQSHTLRQHVINPAATVPQHAPLSPLPDALGVRICTWNCGNAPPPTNFAQLLLSREGAAPTALLVLGLQESVFDTSTSKHASVVKAKTTMKALGGDAASRHVWIEHIMGALGPAFELAGSADLCEVRLLVFARKELRPYISALETATEATGVGHVVGNKGGVCLAMNVGSTSMAFFSCHLAAHQEMVERRNADMAEIFDGTRVGPLKFVDAATQFDHCFILGDLNYRNDLTLLDGHRRESHENHWAKIRAMIEDGLATHTWAELAHADQLTREMAAKRVLARFSEGPLDYAPTFKLERRHDEACAAGLSYVAKRLPSWTDRILWRSAAGQEQWQEWVMPLTDVCSSDHKPLVAHHAIRLSGAAQPMKACHGDTSVSVTFSQLRAANLRSSDINGLSDPYIRFVCKELLWSEQRVATRDIRPRDCPRTPTVKASLNPTWAQPVKTLGTVQGGICAVQQMQFFIVLWDEDSVSQDDELGCAVLPMNSVCDGKPHEFLLEVEKNGSNAGTICGTVQVRIVDMSQGPDKLTRYHLRNINTLIRTVD
jgi:hypothetical protein